MTFRDFRETDPWSSRMNSSVVRTELSYFGKTDELLLGTGRSGQPAHKNAKPPKTNESPLTLFTTAKFVWQRKRDQAITLTR